MISGSSLKCDQCTAEFLIESDLLQHIHSHHLNDRTTNTFTLFTIIDAAIATHQQSKRSPSQSKTRPARRAESISRMPHSQPSIILEDSFGPSFVSVDDTGSQPSGSNSWANKLFAMQSGMGKSVKSQSTNTHGASRPVNNSSSNQPHMLPGAHYSCPLCMKVFLSRLDLDLHRRNKHVEKKSVDALYKCSICSKDFDHEKKLLTHVSSKHKNETANQPAQQRITAKKGNTASNGHANIKHTCSLCAKVFPSQSDLNRHTLTDHISQPGYRPIRSGAKTNSENSNQPPPKTGIKGGLYKCTTCKQEFNTKRKLKSHAEQEHGEKAFCSICSKVFASALALSQHDLVKHSLAADPRESTSIEQKGENEKNDDVLPFTSSYACSLCSKVFLSPSFLDHHQQSKHGEHITDKSSTPVSLSTAVTTTKSATPSSVRNVPRQKKTQLEEPRIVTADVPRKSLILDTSITTTSLSQSDLDSHRRSKNVEKNSSKKSKQPVNSVDTLLYKCSICSKDFDHEQKLLNHVKSKHEIVTPSQSKTKVPTASSGHANIKEVNLTQHSKQAMMDHYSCSLCAKVFPSQSDLNRHTLTDHISQPGYRPIRSGAKTNSENSNQPPPKTGIKGGLYKCTTCKQEFNTKRKLKSHAEQEHGEKAFCSICSKVFTSVLALSQHDLVKHSIAADPRESTSIDQKGGRDEKMFLSPSFLDLQMQSKHSEHIQQKIFPDKNSATLPLSAAVVVVGADTAIATATQPPQHSSSMPPAGPDNPKRRRRRARPSVRNAPGKDALSPEQPTSNWEEEFQQPQLEETQILKEDDVPLKPLSDTIKTKLSSLQMISSDRQSGSGVPISHDDYDCDTSLYDEEEEEDDDSSVLSTEQYACPLCTKVFLSPVDLDRHQKSKHDEEQTPISIGSLLNGTGSSESVHTCLICAKEFNGEENLKRHLRTDHTNAQHSTSMRIYDYYSFAPNPPATVSITSEQYKSNTIGIVQVKKDENDSSTSSAIHESAESSTYNCSLCAKKFDLERRLHGHMIKKHPQKAICIICGIMFKNNVALKQHLDFKHHNSQSCSICRTEFKNNIASQKYVDNQHVEQAYCPICEKEVENISAHMTAQHSRCLLCGKNCRKYKKLQKHMDVAHKVNLTCCKCVQEMKWKLLREKSRKHSKKPMVTSSTTTDGAYNKKLMAGSNWLDDDSSISSSRYAFSLTDDDESQQGEKDGEPSHSTVNIIMTTRKECSANLSNTSEIESTYYSCSFCAQNFDLERRLNVHMQTKHGVEAMCIVCGKECKNSLILQQHWNQKHHGRADNCTTCGAIEKLYVDSSQRDTSNCIICSKEVARITVHMNAMHSTCVICAKSCGTYRKLQRHMDGTHNVTCFICAQEIKRNLDLSQRQYADHSDTTHPPVGDDGRKELLNKVHWEAIPQQSTEKKEDEYESSENSVILASPKDFYLPSHRDSHRHQRRKHRAQGGPLSKSIAATGIKRAEYSITDNSK